MIARLRGEVSEREPGRLLVDVQGVGYEVEIPLSTYYDVGEPGSVCTLHIYTHVREDALQLFGFPSAAERATFLTLIGVNGVGPRMALAILSGIGADDLAVCVQEQDRARLQRVPGVGKKTAERLLLELRDKLKPGVGTGAVASAATPAVDAQDDAVSALVNLGYSKDVAEKAVERVRREQPNAELEATLRGALSTLVRA